MGAVSHDSEELSMQSISTIGLDMAKSWMRSAKWSYAGS